MTPAMTVAELITTSKSMYGLEQKEGGRLYRVTESGRTLLPSSGTCEVLQVRNGEPLDLVI